MTISQKAVELIVAQEDGSEAYYNKTENHWDWPGGASGPTIGVGYDCGYVTHDECLDDWTGIVDDATLQKILYGVGKVGDMAHIFVLRNRLDVTVTWDQALREFIDRELPKWEVRMAKALPNWDHLSGDCAGALLSIGYNRGISGFSSTLPRYREMFAITGMMRRGQWPLIIGEIVAMARLWPNVVDLRRRRALEAQLFAGGVADCKPLVVPGEEIIA
jgi:hypothetical protein